MNFLILRDAPEPTGEEGEDADAELPKVYEPVSSEKELFDRFEMFLAQFNEMVRGSGMDLVFFPDAMLHLVKISRVLRHPRGNMMLVGLYHSQFSKLLNRINSNTCSRCWREW